MIKNIFPTENDSKLAIIGEAPGAEEERQNAPFVGPSGKLLTFLLSRAGISRASCFIGNVCQVRPPRNNISAFKWNGPEITAGLAQLQADLDKHNPNCCLLLGATAMKAAGFAGAVNDLRGSVLMGQAGPFDGRKCVISLHPASVLHTQSDTALLAFDINKAARESKTREIVRPARTAKIGCSLEELIYVLESWPSGQPAAFDLEGNCEGITCFSISQSSGFSWAFPMQDGAGNPSWPLEAEMRLWRAFAKWASRKDIPKILQNSLYDRFVLAYNAKINLANVVDDTMLKGWEIYPELRKSLAVQASIWTDEPYYKDERTKPDWATHLNYCCKDSMVTHEISEKQDAVLSPAAREHYKFNIAALNPLMFMQLRGIRYDKQRERSLREGLLKDQAKLQEQLNQLAGHDLNVKSPAQVNKFLYEELALPAVHKLESGRRTDRLTSDVDACLRLFHKTQRKEIELILRIRAIRDTVKYLDMKLDDDGRVRCSYNIVGTETGRLSCRESATGSGTNLTTITKKLRCLYVADPGYHFFQADLAGADGWTVAARCADLGDDTMLLDYYAGIKPAKVIALMYQRGIEVNKMSRDELKDACKEVSQEGWLYFSCKRTQHGSNYLMQPTLLSQVILKDSYKLSGVATFVPTAECRKLQHLYFTRYPGIRLWHDWVQRQLRSKQLTDASGHVRRFFGNPNSLTTLKEALAHEPQANTTFATNLAMLALWNDKDNRDNGAIVIEPLHSVHDALCGQFPIEKTDWARQKIKEYFSNSLKIGSVELTIPFEGGYGPSWGECINAI